MEKAMNSLLKLQSKCTWVNAEWDNLHWHLSVTYKGRGYCESGPTFVTVAKEVLRQMDLDLATGLCDEGEP
jgi:hypothetical protein